MRASKCVYKFDKESSTALDFFLLCLSLLGLCKGILLEVAFFCQGPNLEGSIRGELCLPSIWAHWLLDMERTAYSGGIQGRQ